MIQDLLQQLSEKGVVLYVSSGKLRFKGRKGALTDALRKRVQEHKQSLIAHLQQNSLTEGTEVLSSAQRRIWVLSQMDKTGALYNVPLAFHLKGHLHVPSLEAAFQELIERHDTLRTSIYYEEGEPWQRCHQEVPFQLRYQDLSAMSNPDTVLKDIELKEELEPFDLEKAPLIRAVLVKLEDQAHMLFISMHHIITDGWSISVLMRDLAWFYQKHQGRDQEPLPVLSANYRQFTRNQQYYLGNTDKMRQYWLEKLGGNLPALDLPLDFLRPALQGFNGAEHSFRFDGERGRGFDRLARTYRCSPFILFVSLLKVLLFRYTGESDITIGTPIGGRPHLELENLVGCFLNTLALRDRLDAHQSFSQIVEQVRTTATDAYDHQGYPFERLVGELDLKRDLSRSPLFDIMVVSQTDRNLKASLGELTLTPHMKPASISKFDMTFHISSASYGLAIAAEYNRDLFSEKRVARLCEHLQGLLDAVLAEPNQAIYKLNFMLNQPTVGLNGKPPEKARQTLLDCFREQVLVRPSERALILARESSAQLAQTRTYEQLDADSNRVARHLMAHDVGPGSLVGIYMTRSLNLCAGLLGILKAGAAYVPMDPDFPAQRLSYMLSHSGASLVLCDETTLQQSWITSKCLDINCLVEMEPACEGALPPVEPEQCAYVIYTSGSTGKPKGVAISHMGLCNFLRSSDSRPGLLAGDRFLAVTSLSFDISTLELFLPLITGAQVVLAPSGMSSDGSRLAAAIRTEAITTMQATPMTWRLLLNQDPTMLRGLKVLCGGEALPTDLAHQLQSFAQSVWNMYGPTETTVWSSCERLTKDSEHLGSMVLGQPFRATKLYVLDPWLQPIPMGSKGELFIGGDGLARGYHKNAALTAQRFLPDPFSEEAGARMYRTGDRACFFEREAGLTPLFLGRDDGQIKLRGFRIELGEIEAAILALEMVDQAVALLHGPEETRRIIAYVSFHAHYEVREDDIARLREQLAESLPGYMIPATFVAVTQWPLTPNGKIDRKQLSALDVQFSSVPHVPPRDEVEAQVAGIWSEVLNKQIVGVHDRFFELGGHSLTAARTIHAINRAVNGSLSLIDIFRHPTVAGLASLIKQSPVQQQEYNSVMTINAHARELSADLGVSPLNLELSAAELEALYEL